MRGIVFYGTTGKFTWRMLATVLGGEALCIALGALVARGLAATDGTASPTAYLVVGFGLAALAVVAAGTLRRPWGITLGLGRAGADAAQRARRAAHARRRHLLPHDVGHLPHPGRPHRRRGGAARGGCREAETAAGTAPGPAEAGGSADGPADRVGE